MIEPMERPPLGSRILYRTGIHRWQGDPANRNKTPTNGISFERNLLRNLVADLVGRLNSLKVD